MRRDSFPSLFKSLLMRVRYDDPMDFYNGSLENINRINYMHRCLEDPDNGRNAH